MPLVNYCKKCRTEVPVGETCLYCGGKLTKTGEQVSFGAICHPIQEWSRWKYFLRFLVPVWVLVTCGCLAAEAFTGGMLAAAEMLSGGYLLRMLAVLGIMLLPVPVLLILQGTEQIHYVLDKDGIHARTYLQAPSVLRLWAHFQTRDSLRRLQESDERPPLKGYTQVRRISLPWEEIRRIQIWKEGETIRFYHPRFRLVLSLYCPPEEQDDVCTLIRKKMKRFKNVPVLPREESRRK